MTYSRLRNVSKFSLIIGVAFLLLGIALFIFSDAGDKTEKLGVVLMMYSGIMLGVGFTALVALKSP